MRISEQMLRRMEYDLALNSAFRKGADLPVSNCWHFCTDGNAVDSMFFDNRDFIDGMNRLYLTSRRFLGMVILAFVLMDTHLHIVTYGDYDVCNRFFHEYLRRTSMFISSRHSESKKLKGIRASCHKIDTDAYLKKAICYVIKNPTSAGLPYNPYDYPWSSGSLYFRSRDLWTSPAWSTDGQFTDILKNMGVNARRSYLKSKDIGSPEAAMSRGLIFPGEYVAVEIVERIFRTCRSFNFFLGNSREEDMDTLAARISRLSMPIQELRQHRDELGRELFSATGIRRLDMNQRLKLARILRARYCCSAKQVSKLCGLVYDEIQDRI